MKLLLKIWKFLSFSKFLRVMILKTVNDQFLVGVTGVIFNHKNQVLVLKHTYRKTAWSLPGGYLKASEHPKAGLAREIEEETGLKVKILKNIRTQTNHEGRLDMSYFGVYQSGKFKSSEEVSHHKFVHENKLPKLMKDQYEQIAEALKRKKAHDLEQRIEKISHFLPNLFRKAIRYNDPK